jgi:phosphatidylglycerophosphate synthase
VSEIACLRQQWDSHLHFSQSLGHNGSMLAVLMSGGWNILIIAALFILAFLVIVSAIRREKIELAHGWFAKSLLAGWALLLTGTLLLFLWGFLAPGPLVRPVIYTLWVLSIVVVLATFAFVAAYTVSRLRYYWRTFRGKSINTPPTY